MFWGFVIFAVVLGVVLFAISVYNRLVGVKHAVSQAWANVDVLLKQRHDELPKLVDVCRAYMSFERETLLKVMNARAAAHAAREARNVAGVGEAETQMRTGLGRLFALAEGYPELRSSDSFQQLQKRISLIEDSIADRREFYNESVNTNNVLVEQLPGVILAALFGFRPAPLLEFADAETADPGLQELFDGKPATTG
jgi:LemA protein